MYALYDHNPDLSDLVPDPLGTAGNNCGRRGSILRRLHCRRDWQSSGGRREHRRAGVTVRPATRRCRLHTKGRGHTGWAKRPGHSTVPALYPSFRGPRPNSVSSPLRALRHSRCGPSHSTYQAGAIDGGGTLTYTGVTKDNFGFHTGRGARYFVTGDWGVRVELKSADHWHP